MAEYRQNASYGFISKKPWEPAKVEIEEDGGHSNKYSLPYGLCKKYGIDLPDGARPREAWEALKKHGVYPPYSEEGKDQYDEETGEHKDEEKADGEEKKENSDKRFKTRDEAKKYLYERKLICDKSLDSVEEKLFIENADKLAELDKKFGFMKNNKESILFTAEAIGAGTIAKTNARGVGDSFRTTRLILNSRYYSKTEELKKIEEYANKTGQSVPYEETQTTVYAITHEYGHIAFEKIIADDAGEESQRLLDEAMKSTDYYEMDKIFAKARKVPENVAKQIVKEIKSIAKSKFGDKSMFMSSYGLSTPHEWLAEAFANSQCGSPNALGLATSEYLKKRGY